MDPIISGRQTKEAGPALKQDVTGRIPQIDALRAVAVMLVIFRHIHDDWPGSESGFVFQVFQVLHRGGWMGVDLFFVLSGFLVSGLLFREHVSWGKVDVWRFLVRRGFKIYPAFWILILVTVCVDYARHTQRPPFALVCELAFVQNYGRSIWNHTWSLAVEEHFYLGFALLILGLVKLNRSSHTPFQSVPIIAALVLVLVFVDRCWVSFYFPYSHKSHFLTHLRIDSLMFGVLLSWLFWYRQEQLRRMVSRHRGWLLAGGLLLVGPPFLVLVEGSRLMLSLGLSALYFGSGALLLLALYFPIRMGWTARILAAIGFHSYSIYLWHMPVIYWLMPALEKLMPGLNLGSYILFSLAGSLVTGIAAARLVEIPVLLLRDRLFPSLASRRSLPQPIAAGIP